MQVAPRGYWDYLRRCRISDRGFTDQSDCVWIRVDSIILHSSSRRLDFSPSWIMSQGNSVQSGPVEQTRRTSPPFQGVRNEEAEEAEEVEEYTEVYTANRINYLLGRSASIQIILQSNQLPRIETQPLHRRPPSMHTARLSTDI